MFSLTKSKGSATFMLLTIVGVLYIFGTMIINYMVNERTQTNKLAENMRAYYLAEAAVELGKISIKDFLIEPLMDAQGKVNEEILSILDIDRAENFMKKYKIKDGELIEGGEAEVTIQFTDLKSTPFGTHIDEYEEVPHSLKMYLKQDRNTYPAKTLGGWEGILRMTAKATYNGTTRKMEVIREIKVTDITPPAENYTLFVAGNKNEYIKCGGFRLQNWSIVRDLQTFIERLGVATTDAFKGTLGKVETFARFIWQPENMHNADYEGEVRLRTFRAIREHVMSMSDLDIKDFVDTTIQHLQPFLWGKVRTNGRMHVYLPFFAADDIINYFEDNAVFSHQRPEIGYLFCNNQLHDPYLSKYTYYEGELIRYYQKLKPYVLGVTETPYPSSEPYTINTRFDFVQRNPTQLKPMQLERIQTEAKNYCHEFFDNDLVLKGSYLKPILQSGLVYVQGNVYIGGEFNGRAMIVTEGDIILTDDVTYSNDFSLLSLVALNGSVRFASGLDKAKLEAAVYAHNSIVGGGSIIILGNLVVHNLNRQAGEDGDNIMPSSVKVTYDTNLKSKVATNICYNISEQIVTLRDL